MVRLVRIVFVVLWIFGQACGSDDKAAGASGETDVATDTIGEPTDIKQDEDADVPHIAEQDTGAGEVFGDGALDDGEQDDSGGEAPDVSSDIDDATSEDDSSEDGTSEDGVSIDDTADDDVSVGDTTNDDVSVDDTTNDDVSVDDTTNDDVSIDDTTNDDVSVDDTTNDDTTDDDTTEIDAEADTSSPCDEFPHALDCPCNLHLDCESGHCDEGICASACNGGAPSGEICDGIDNDCDGQTDEDWPLLGLACDGDDEDLCANGLWICEADGVVCAGDSVVAEVCDGLDNNCDGQTDELWPELGSACDGADADACALGTWACAGTGTACEGDVEQHEICNGLDDDCDGATDELWPELGQACDGDDADECASGTWQCAGGAVGCVGDVNIAEICNGVDDDCDGQTDEGVVVADPFVCAVDACGPNGLTHTPNHALCDDGLSCNGVETCEPSHPQANTAGCLAGAPPAEAFFPSTVCAVAVGCNSATGGVDWQPAPAGIPCDDTIDCTQNDVCDGMGACRGEVTAACAPVIGASLSECASTEPLPTAVDVPVALVEGGVTFDGAAPPSLSPIGGNPLIWLEAQDTGMRHRLQLLSYDYGNVAGQWQYQLLAQTAAFSRKLIPGVYDVIYQRNLSSNAEWVNETSTMDTLVNGYRRIQSGVVIGAGVNQLDIDIPSAMVSGTITQGGQPLPTLDVVGGNIVIWLVAKDTGFRHRLQIVSYDYGNYGGKWQYQLVGGADSFSRRVIPGVYDVIYQRNLASSGEWVNETNTLGSLVNGYRTLATDVVIGAGANQLNIDIPVTTLTLNVTYAGGEWPSLSPIGGNPVIWLAAKDTGFRHRFLLLSYEYGNYEGKWQYKLTVPPSVTRLFVPGTYDVLYQRNLSSGGGWVNETNTLDTIANGYRALQTNVIVGAGAQTLDVDVPESEVQLNATFDGQAPPQLSKVAGNPVFWLRAKDTGFLHRILLLSYDYGNFQGAWQYQISVPPSITRKILPGSYDLLYQRNLSSSSEWVNETNEIDTLVNGMRVLQSNIEVGPGLTIINADVATATVKASVTMGGQALPPLSKVAGNPVLWLVAHDTGFRHRLELISYDYGNHEGAWQYALGFSGEIHRRVLPGTYDLIYQRNLNSGGEWVNETNSIDTLVNGYRRLQANIALVAGLNILNIDVPVTNVQSGLTMSGASLPQLSVMGGNPVIWLVARDTGFRHRVELVSYDYGNHGGKWQYKLNHPGAIDRMIVPGIYDVLYQRNLSSNATSVNETSPLDTIVNGYRILHSCVEIP